MTYKDLFYFTGHCLSLDEHPEFRETIRSREEAGEINWEWFVELCSDHLIIPVIYLKFRDHQILELLEDELEQELRKIYELNRERNTQILQQIDRICMLLHPEEIYPVFLKGTANLLDGLYSDLGERMIGDIDFLVPEVDFLRTAAIMEGEGYKHAELLSYVDYNKRKHYPSLYKKGLTTSVEIHRTPVSNQNSANHKPEMVFWDKKLVSGKPGYYVPSDEHKLMHTFLHSQLENLGHACKQPSFRGFYDLYLLSKRMDVTLLAGQTTHKHKAIAWQVLCGRVFNLHDRIYEIETNRARLFCLKYDLSMSFIRTYQIYTNFKRFVRVLINAIVSRDERQFLFRRLKDPNWYRDQFLSN